MNNKNIKNYLKLEYQIKKIAYFKILKLMKTKKQLIIS